jgi:hypothetical protein
MYHSILDGKVPAFKEESEVFSIISEYDLTMKHPIIDTNIDEYASKVNNSGFKAGFRTKPLFAIVTGVGRGKTRTLIELQKRLNEFPDTFCIAITFNKIWGEILRPDVSKHIASWTLTYVVNIITRIMSVNYHIAYDERFFRELYAAISKLDPATYSVSDLISELIKYIVNQYITEGKPIRKFVLLVDESVVIQDELASLNAPNDVHKVLRECLLSAPITVADGSTLKVDLVMSG